MKKNFLFLAIASLAIGNSFVEAQSYSIYGSSEIDLSSCNPNGPTGTVVASYWVLRKPTVTGPTSIRFNNLPADVHVTFSPMQLTYPGWVTGELVTVTFQVNAGVGFPDQVIEIEAFDGSSSATNQIILHGTCPRHNKDFTIRGSFFTSNLGVIFPVEHGVVEIYRDVSWGFDQHVSTVRTEKDGSFEAHLWANNEDTYYAKLRLNDMQGVYLHDWWNPSIRDYNSYQRGRNSNPVIDLGVTLISRDGGKGTPKVSVWQGGRAAYQEFISSNGVAPPTGDYEIVIQDTKGLSPWTARSTTNWEDGTETRKFNNVLPVSISDPAFDPYFSQFLNYSVNFHEFGHALRHTVDGDQRHFTDDASRWTYGRKHSLCGSDPGYVEIEAFGFNEGWAEYWARDLPDDIQFNCPSIKLSDMTIEGAVATDLHRLSHALNNCISFKKTDGTDSKNAADSEMVRRKSMFNVINRGQNIMHSEGEFRSNFQQQFPGCIVPLIGNIGVAHLASRGLQYRYLADPKKLTTSFRQKLRNIDEYVKQLQRDINKSISEIKKVNVKGAANCDSCIAMLLRPALLNGQYKYAQLLSKIFTKRSAYLNGSDYNSDPYGRLHQDTQRDLEEIERQMKQIHFSVLKESVSILKKNFPNSKSVMVKDRIAWFERQLRLMDLRTPKNDDAYILMDLPEWFNDDKVMKWQKEN